MYSHVSATISRLKVLCRAGFAGSTREVVKPIVEAPFLRNKRIRQFGIFRNKKRQTVEMFGFFRAHSPTVEHATSPNGLDGARK